MTEEIAEKNKGLLRKVRCEHFNILVWLERPAGVEFFTTAL